MADIEALDDEAIGNHRLRLVELASGIFAEQYHFKLHLETGDRISDRPVFHGMASSGHRDLERYLEAEQAVHGRLIARREAYPDLEGNELVGDLMDRMTALEDEVALMRHGYNDAVELYNARIESFPDVWLANTFRFVPEEFIGEPRELPVVSMT